MYDREAVAGATMRAAIYRRRGPARGVLEVVELPIPEPQSGEVRVRVHVSAVNPTDWKARTGSDPLEHYEFQVPNQDGSGVIDAVGRGVNPSRVGQRVWLYFAAYHRQIGTAAEYICLPSEQAVRLPDGASFELGASLGIPAMTAHRCLFADGDVAGVPVLVAGGAGAVGYYAVQLARRTGATVIATVSGEDKGRIATEAGAHHVVNYQEPDAADQIKALAPGGIVRIVEVAPAVNMRLDLAVSAQNASAAIYATDPGDRDDLTVPAFDLMRRNLVLRFVLVYTMGRDVIRAAVDEITEAVEAGALTEMPLHRFTLDQIAEAHEAVEQNAVGKVLIDIGQDSQPA
jgi:NADPH2:quinone reductase